jgi:DNA/RNA-binding domain of Phe-tRNA-synthetase-like protein
MIKISEAVKAAYPGANFGVLTIGGLRSNSDRSIMDYIIKDEIGLIREAHHNYERKAALATEPLCHYAAYYKKWGKSYHVLGQLESILLKGKGIPPVGAPIEAMFLAEVKNLLLTAGHDLDLLDGDLTVDIAAEPLSYMGISGKDQQLVKSDLYLSDKQGVLSSVIGGPDFRTRITDATQNALYFIYGVEGVGVPLISSHLKTIESYLSQAIQGVKSQRLEVF